MKYQDLYDIIREETKKLLKEYSSNVIVEEKNDYITSMIKTKLESRGVSLDNISREDIRIMITNIQYLLAAAASGQLNSTNRNMDSIVELVIKAWQKNKGR